MVKRIRAANALFVAGEQPDETVFPALDPAADGIFAEGTAISYDVQTAETNEDTGSLDRGERRATGISAQVTSRVYLVGTDTPGTPPRWGRLMRAAGFAEQITAAPIPAAPEAVGDGSTTTTVVLGASAPGMDQAVRGMPLVLSGDMDVTTFISDYDGATKTATVTDELPAAPTSMATQYQVLANVLYRPASEDIPLLASELFLDGLRVRVDGMQGAVQSVWATRGVPALDFTFTARFVDEQDVAMPSINDARPPKPIFAGGVMKLDRKALAISTFTLNPQSQVELGDDPNEAFGFSPAATTGRQMQATLDPEMRLIADGGDVMASVIAGTEFIGLARAGTLAGNRPALVLPRAARIADTPGTRGAFRTRDVTLDLRGADAGAFLCLF